MVETEGLELSPNGYLRQVIARPSIVNNALKSAEESDETTITSASRGRRLARIALVMVVIVLIFLFFFLQYSVA